LGHGTNAPKVLAHHKKAVLAVFDGVFGLANWAKAGNAVRVAAMIKRLRLKNIEIS
jgi:hypothetical protein